MTRPIESQTWGWGKHPYLVKRVTFDFGEARMVAQQTRFSGEPVEVYVVEDGLERFVGFLGEVAAKHPALAVAAVEALA